MLEQPNNTTFDRLQVSGKQVFLNIKDSLTVKY